MKIIIPGTIDVPPPPELAALFTTTDSATPAGTVLKTKDKAGKGLGTNNSQTSKGTPSASQWADFLHNMKIWKATHPAQPDPTAEWWKQAGQYARKRLADWMNAQAKRAAKGESTAPDDPAEQGADPSKKKDQRPPPPQDTQPFGTPGKASPNAKTPADPSPYPARHPPYTILESATQAAEWLAGHWPQDVADQGYDAFIDARKRDVLEMIWTPRYWEPLERLDPTACVSQAYSVVDPDWERPPFNDPEHKRGIATYAKPGAPYPLPAPYTTGDQPSPGYFGEMPADFLTDRYSACWIENYTLPTRWNVQDMPPTFLDTHANHYVNADAPPSKVQFGTYSLPHIYQTAAPGAAEMLTLPLYGRRYNWTRKIPPGGATAYSGHMRRHFVQDCRVMALLNPGAGGACDRLSIQLAPCAAMSRYFGKATRISTEFTLENPAAYVAKTSNSLEGVDFFTQKMLWLAHIDYTYTIISTVPLVAIYVFRDDRLGYPTFPTHPGLDAAMAGTIAEEATSGKILRIPPYDSSQGGCATMKQWPPEVGDGVLYPTQQYFAYMRQQYGVDDEPRLYSTVWQTPDGRWFNAPGRLTIPEIVNRS